MDNNYNNNNNYNNDYDPNQNYNNGYPQNPNPSPDYNQNYNQQNQNPYNGYPNNYNNMAGVDPELEKKASTIKTLGIVSIVTSVVLMCCCTIVGPVVGIVGLVQANNLNQSMNMLSPQSQDNLKNGKLMCIIGIVLGAIGILVNIILSATGATDAFWEGFQEGLEESMKVTSFMLPFSK